MISGYDGVCPSSHVLLNMLENDLFKDLFDVVQGETSMSDF